MANSGGKLPLWVFWVVATVVSGLAAIMCLVTFADLASIQYDDAAGRPATELNGCLAGTMMSAVLLILLAVVSFLILVRKTWTQSGTGFSYGFIDSAYLFCAFFALLTGIVLTSHKSQTSTWQNSLNWPQSATNAFVATYVLLFMTSVVFVLTFLALILWRRAVQDKELRMDELDARLRDRGPRMSQMSEVPVAGAPASPDATLPASRSAPGGAWTRV